ncbi:MAG: putative tRNA-dihydrouridine synthase [Syntrophus sp. PtaB.Bin001]|nr:MAG: putative tRNA-dihydrouridine synthase [Syntrophus sp. PtaB.Bin001]
MMNLGSLKIGNNIVLAPMAGISNLSFRVIAREKGCSLAFTEMISANGLVRQNLKSSDYMLSSSEDKPLGVQIFGNDPVIMAEAAQIVAERGADLIDINMGCPVKKVVKNGAGAALLKDPGLVSQILAAVRKATQKPLTVKIRSGWNVQNINAVQIARIAEEQGVDAVIVHARTAVQGFSGSADWTVIEKVKNSVGIKVIGNGDVKSGGDAWRMVETTGCDGVMIGRGSLGNPWIFTDVLTYQSTKSTHVGPTLHERKEMILRHFNRESGFGDGSNSVKRFRKHLLWYTRGLRGGSAFRAKVTAISEKKLLLQEIENFFEQAELPYQQIRS